MTKCRFRILIAIVFNFIPILLFSQIRVNNVEYNIDGIFKDPINKNYVSIILVNEKSSQNDKDYSNDIKNILYINIKESQIKPVKVYTTLESRKRNYALIFDINQNFNVLYGQDEEYITLSDKNIFKEDDISSSEILQNIFVCFSVLKFRDVFDKDSMYYFDRFKNITSNITKIPDDPCFNESMAYFKYMEDSTQLDIVVDYLNKSFTFGNLDIKFLNNYSKLLYKSAINNYYGDKTDFSLVKSRLDIFLSINTPNKTSLIDSSQIDSAKYIRAKCSYFIMKETDNKSPLVKEIEEYVEELPKYKNFYYDALLLLGNAYFRAGEKYQAIEKYSKIINSKNSDNPVKPTEEVYNYAKDNLELLNK